MGKCLNLPPQSKYPKQIYFADEVYQVIFKKRFHCYGETDPGKKTITIKAGISPRATFVTFIHEVTHMMDMERNIQLTHKQVYKLERAISELLLDNFL